jgi:hypothetical protein
MEIVPTLLLNPTTKTRLLQCCKQKGTYELMINSKTPITQSMILQQLILNGINIHHLSVSVEKRVLKNDLKEIWIVHLLLTPISLCINLFFYLGFYLYELKKPLYIVKLRVGRKPGSEEICLNGDENV